MRSRPERGAPDPATAMGLRKGAGSLVARADQRHRPASRACARRRGAIRGRAGARADLGGGRPDPGPGRGLARPADHRPGRFGLARPGGGCGAGLLRRRCDPRAPGYERRLCAHRGVVGRRHRRAGAAGRRRRPPARGEPEPARRGGRLLGCRSERLDPLCSGRGRRRPADGESPPDRPTGRPGKWKGGVPTGTRDGHRAEHPDANPGHRQRGRRHSRVDACGPGPPEGG